MSIAVNGVKEIQEKLETLGSVMPRITENSVIAGAKVIERGMKRRIGKRSRRTMESIEVGKINRTLAGANVSVGPSSLGKRRFIARFLEFGTSKMPAQPFVRPTKDEDMGEAINAARKIVENAIARVK